MIKGSIVALVTPMNSQGAIDYQALKNLIEFHVDNGTQGVVPVGTTGESPTVGNTEHVEVIQKTVEYVKGRMTVIAGTGSNSTHEAIKQTLAAKSYGVDACLSVAPYYNKPTQKGLKLHFEAIANETKTPIFLYNVPHRTVSNISNDIVVQLAQNEYIVGIKDATGDLSVCKDLLNRCPDDFAIYSGDDETAHELMLLGGHGVISVSANIVPKQMQELCLAAMSDDKTKVSQINESLQLIHKAMGYQSNPIPVKWALNQMNLIGSGIRLPLHELDIEFHEATLSALRKNHVNL